MVSSIVFVHRSISALPSPFWPLAVSTLSQVSPTTIPSKGAPFTSSTVMKIVCIPLAQPLLRASGHSRHDAILKSTAGAGGSVGVTVGGTRVGVAVSTGVGVRVLVGVSVGSGVGESVLVGVGVLVGVLVAVGVNVAVGVRVEVVVGAAVSVADCVAVGGVVAGISAICPLQAASKLIAAT